MGGFEKKLLLAEDEANQAEMLSLVLEASCYRVTWVTDGKSALRKLKHHTFDAVILDIMLPRIDGIELCNIIRHSSSLRDMPIIVVSALAKGSPSSEDEWRDKCQADIFITKPYSVEEFLRRLKSLFERPRKKWDNVREIHLRDFIEIVSRHGLAATAKVSAVDVRQGGILQKGGALKQTPGSGRERNRDQTGHDNIRI